MASSQTPRFRRALFHIMPWLFSECPGGNKHNRFTQKKCVCCYGENNQTTFTLIEGEWVSDGPLWEDGSPPWSTPYSKEYRTTKRPMLPERTSVHSWGPKQKTLGEVLYDVEKPE